MFNMSRYCAARRTGTITEEPMRGIVPPAATENIVLFFTRGFTTKGTTDSAFNIKSLR